jgi:methyl coenzyme M reductase subunit C-like uncharacterized protein (methanogenesis marker protein 7)
MNQQRTPSREGELPPTQQVGRSERRTRSGEEMRPVEDLVEYVRDYTRQRPETVAIACFAVGFILGWRLKPW